MEREQKIMIEWAFRMAISFILIYLAFLQNVPSSLIGGMSLVLALWAVIPTIKEGN